MILKNINIFEDFGATLEETTDALKKLAQNTQLKHYYRKRKIERLIEYIDADIELVDAIEKCEKEYVPKSEIFKILKKNKLKNEN